MEILQKLESQLNDALVKNAPYQLPENVKKWIVQYLPYINLVFGVLTLWAAYGLYRTATVVDRYADVVNSFSRAYGGNDYVNKTSVSAAVWLGLAVLAIQGVLWIVSYPSVLARKKTGWNLLFLALIVNAVYGFVSLFTSYGGIGSLVGYLISTVIGLYFLFQIRSYYLEQKATTKTSVQSTAKTK